LWLDEVLQLSDCYHNSLWHTIDRVAHNPGGVPLTYVVQNIFVNALGHPFYAARLLAILWAVGGMASLIWLVRLLGVSSDWLWPALAYALLPISLRYAIEARQYGPALALGVCATALLLWLDQQPGWSRAVVYVFVLTLGIYSHPYICFVTLAHMAWAYRRPAARYVLTACAISVLLFVPWYLFARSYWLEDVTRSSYPSSFAWKTPLMILHELSGGGYWLTGAMLALAVYGYRRSQIPDSGKQLLLLCILVPVPSVLVANTLFRYFFAIRQLLFIVPPLCVLATEGLRAIENRARLVIVIALTIGALVYDVRWFKLN
jgi:uncharacterized membrane protein